MPRHFSNTLSSESRTRRIPSGCGSKRMWSPGLTPRDLRISTGTVTWPLLVTFARKEGAGMGLGREDIGAIPYMSDYTPYLVIFSSTEQGLGRLAFQLFLRNPGEERQRPGLEGPEFTSCFQRAEQAAEKGRF